MTRRSLIKNMMGAIVGYALLPKVLTEAKDPISLCDLMTPAVDAPGIGGKVFTCKLNTDWFYKGDIIRSEKWQEMIVTEKDETGIKGKFLNPETAGFTDFHFEHTDNTVSHIAERNIKVCSAYIENTLEHRAYDVNTAIAITKTTKYEMLANERRYKNDTAISPIQPLRLRRS